MCVPKCVAQSITMQYSQRVQFNPDTRGGVYGWWMQCLYILVIFLIVVVVSSLLFTLLLLSALSFNLGGIGDLSISELRVMVKESYFLDSLVSSRISSNSKHPLSFKTHCNMSMLVADGTGRPSQMLHFRSDIQEPGWHEVEVTASNFLVNDLKGRILFTADHSQVTIGTDILRVLEGGVKFTGSVQTPMLRSHLGSELLLEAATRKLYVMAPAGVSLESRAADISASCLTNLKLSSTEGKIGMKSPGIFIPYLESIPLLEPHASMFNHPEQVPHAKHHQVCICSNGKLFVAPPNRECRIDNDGVQCH